MKNLKYTPTSVISQYQSNSHNMKKFKILSKIIFTISILFFVSDTFAQTQPIRTVIVNSYETASNSENRSAISYSFARNESTELPIDFETVTSWGNFDGGD